MPRKSDIQAEEAAVSSPLRRSTRITSTNSPAPSRLTTRRISQTQNESVPETKRQPSANESSEKVESKATTRGRRASTTKEEAESKPEPGKTRSRRSSAATDPVEEPKPITRRRRSSAAEDPPIPEPAKVIRTRRSSAAEEPVKKPTRARRGSVKEEEEPVKRSTRNSVDKPESETSERKPISKRRRSSTTDLEGEIGTKSVKLTPVKTTRSSSVAENVENLEPIEEIETTSTSPVYKEATVTLTPIKPQSAEAKRNLDLSVIDESSFVEETQDNNDEPKEKVVTPRRSPRIKKLNSSEKALSRKTLSETAKTLNMEENSPLEQNKDDEEVSKTVHSPRKLDFTDDKPNTNTESETTSNVDPANENESDILQGKSLIKKTLSEVEILSISVGSDGSFKFQMDTSISISQNTEEKEDLNSSKGSNLSDKENVDANTLPSPQKKKPDVEEKDQSIRQEIVARVSNVFRPRMEENSFMEPMEVEEFPSKLNIEEEEPKNSNREDVSILSATLDKNSSKDVTKPANKNVRKENLVDEDNDSVDESFFLYLSNDPDNQEEKAGESKDTTQITTIESGKGKEKSPDKKMEDLEQEVASEETKTDQLDVEKATNEESGDIKHIEDHSDTEAMSLPTADLPDNLEVTGTKRRRSKSPSFIQLQNEDHSSGRETSRKSKSPQFRGSPKLTKDTKLERSTSPHFVETPDSQSQLDDKIKSDEETSRHSKSMGSTEEENTKNETESTDSLLTENKQLSTENLNTSSLDVEEIQKEDSEQAVEGSVFKSPSPQKEQVDETCANVEEESKNPLTITEKNEENVSLQTADESQVEDMKSLEEKAIKMDEVVRTFDDVKEVQTDIISSEEASKSVAVQKEEIDSTCNNIEEMVSSKKSKSPVNTTENNETKSLQTVEESQLNEENTSVDTTATNTQKDEELGVSVIKIKKVWEYVDQFRSCSTNSPSRTDELEFDIDSYVQKLINSPSEEACIGMRRKNRNFYVEEKEPSTDSLDEISDLDGMGLGPEEESEVSEGANDKEKTPSTKKKIKIKSLIREGLTYEEIKMNRRVREIMREIKKKKEKEEAREKKKKNKGKKNTNKPKPEGASGSENDGESSEQTENSSDQETKPLIIKAPEQYREPYEKPRPFCGLQLYIDRKRQREQEKSKANEDVSDREKRVYYNPFDLEINREANEETEHSDNQTCKKEKLGEQQKFDKGKRRSTKKNSEETSDVETDNKSTEQTEYSSSYENEETEPMVKKRLKKQKKSNDSGDVSGKKKSSKNTKKATRKSAPEETSDSDDAESNQQTENSHGQKSKKQKIRDQKTLKEQNKCEDVENIIDNEEISDTENDKESSEPTENSHGQKCKKRKSKSSPANLEKRSPSSVLDDFVTKKISEIEVEEEEEENVDEPNDFVCTMAEEGEEDTPSEDSNAIVDEGESIGSTDSEYGSSNEEYDEDDSFICDEENEQLLSGEEYDLGNEKTKKKKSRIIHLDNYDDDDDIIPIQKKKTTAVKKKRSRIVSVSDSSEEEVEVLKDTSSEVFEGITSEKTIKISEESTPEKLSVEEKSDDEVFIVKDTPTKQYTEASSSFVQSTTSQQHTEKKRCSVTIHGNVKDSKGSPLSERIVHLVDGFCTTVQEGQISFSIQDESSDSEKSTKGVKQRKKTDMAVSVKRAGRKRRLSKTLGKLHQSEAKRYRNKNKKKKVENKKVKDKQRERSLEDNPSTQSSGLINQLVTGLRKKAKPDSNLNSSWTTEEIPLQSSVRPSTRTFDPQELANYKASKVHPKDFRSQMLNDPSRVRRIETKKLLKKKGVYL